MMTALDLKATRVVGAIMLVLGVASLLPGFALAADTIASEGRILAPRPLLCSFVIGLPLVVFGLLKLLRPADHP